MGRLSFGKDKGDTITHKVEWQNIKTRDHFRCGREYRVTEIFTQLRLKYKSVQPLWENK